MPNGDIVIVFDCGATNVRVIAINSKGVILASESFPNNTCADPQYPKFRIWDVQDIWKKMCTASRSVVSKIKSEEIIGVTITTFGVDGTFVDNSGKLLYPVISWQCDRTKPILAGIDKYLSIKELYKETGVLPFSFNTINKLIWFAENIPSVIEKSHAFLFLPSIFSNMLTGELWNDTTMAGTSMLTDLVTRNFSPKILDKINFPAGKIPAPVEAGTITGRINKPASEETSLPVGIPVVSTGHDTQFAIFGSGAGLNQPVLSSGTWEVLMVRSENFRSGPEQMETGITTELDAIPGLYNIGNQWIASGLIEWARKNLFGEITGNVYDYMNSGAEQVPQGSNGVEVVPDFNESRDGKPAGQIRGLTLQSTRHEIYRSILESLSLRLAKGKLALENAGGFKTESILCVGGGSRNRLWNQMRADYAGVPLKVIDQKECTVLGASLFVQAACGSASSPEEARRSIRYRTEIFEPGNSGSGTSFAG